MSFEIMKNKNTIKVTVVYALPNIQYIYEISCNKESTVKEAILESNIFKSIKNISFHKNRVGIYNRLVDLKSKIQDGDRIEIYRTLIIDPKERRRKKKFLLLKK